MYQKNKIFIHGTELQHCVDTPGLRKGRQLRKVHIYFCYTIVSCNIKLLIHFVDETRLTLIVYGLLWTTSRVRRNDTLF